MASISKLRSSPPQPFRAPGDPNATGLIYRLCLNTSKPVGPCTSLDTGATVWTIQAARGFRGERGDAASRGPRYIAMGPGLSPEAAVEGDTITIKGVLPAGIHAGSELYVSVSREGGGGIQAGQIPAQAIRLEGLGSPEMNLATLKKQDGPFPVIFESFYYPESPRPNDLTCSVINALGDRFDLLATIQTFASTTRRLERRAQARLVAGAVTGIGATQRNLASYCTKGRFQWQFVQPVYMGANQMDEYPPRRRRYQPS